MFAANGTAKARIWYTYQKSDGDTREELLAIAECGCEMKPKGRRRTGVEIEASAIGACPDLRSLPF